MSSDVYDELPYRALCEINSLLTRKVAGHVPLPDTQECYCGSTHLYARCCKKTPRFYLGGTKVFESLRGYAEHKKWRVGVDDP